MEDFSKSMIINAFHQTPVGNIETFILQKSWLHYLSSNTLSTYAISTVAISTARNFNLLHFQPSAISTSGLN